MENSIEKAVLDFNEWWEICSFTGDIHDIMAMMQSLRELDLLRSSEVELEM